MEKVHRHEHGSHDPMVEDRRDGSEGQECCSRVEAALRYQDDGTCVQHDATSQREDNELDNDKGSDLRHFETTNSCMVGCTTHLHYQQLLPNGIANGLTCILDIPDSEDIQVEGHQERHDEVAQ